MSGQPISHSDDLRRLRDEGYELEARDGYLCLHHVPYVNETGAVKYGTLVSTLNLAGDVTAAATPHTVMFAGEAPCDEKGGRLNLIAGSGRKQLANGLVVAYTFSRKPAGGRYPDYYEKMTAYAEILSAPAQALMPEVTAKTFGVITESDPESVFNYVDTASSRAGITAISDRLRGGKLAIVGLGGSGSYVLDLVSKTPIAEIHLYDGDVFSQHNAFRAPGAPSVAELRRRPRKATYWQRRYAKMRRNIFAHPDYINESNVDALGEMDFVFLCLDDGEARKLIVDNLEASGTAFIDIGMGVYEVNGSLGGLVRVTASTPDQRDHVHDNDRIPFAAPDPDNEYEQNIQIADLNALNATLAVIKWKKLAGFYLDLEREHFSVYEVDGNSLLNEDQSSDRDQP